ncbi:MAG: hypothetical protein ACI9AT_000440 [Ulvibacter sp.]|jgi:hypothetical protein
MIERDYLRLIGFEEIPHFTVMHAMTYDLGRRRFLSVGSIATPNEMVFIKEMDHDDPRKVTDMVCLHNFDYDGYLTEEKIESIIYGATGKKVDPNKI